MAAFLVISSEAFEVMDFSRRPNATGGELKRTLSGQLRGDSFWSARVWEAEILCLDTATVDKLYARANPNLNVAVSGEGIDPAGVTARVRITGDKYKHGANGAHYRTISIEIMEQL